MKARHYIAIPAVAGVLALGASWYNAATAVPPPIGGECGGQQWHAIAPIECTKTKTIDGTTVSIRVLETGAGDLTVLYEMAAPRNTNTLIHVTSHSGNSDEDGATPISAHDIIPTGQTAGSLHIAHALCGQIDIRFAIDNKAGRVAGPYILNDSCAVTPPTTTPTTSPPSSPATTVPTSGPGSSSTTTPGTAPPTVPGTNTVPPGAKLAATGSNTLVPSTALGLLTVAVGGGLIFATRRRAT